MSIYKENISDIVDNWNSYPLADPCGKYPAQNAGTVELKCFINNTCPFYSSPYQEDGLIFNEATFKRIKPWLPETLKNALTVTPGTQGIHFSPRWVFRHNYIYQKYDLEYGSNEMGISPNIIKDRMKVHVHDDLLATGGSVNNVIELIRRMGGFVDSVSFIIELDFLNGREKLEKTLDVSNKTLGYVSLN